MKFLPSLEFQKTLYQHVANIPQSKVITVEEYTSDEYMLELLEYHLRALLNEKGILLLEKYLYELK